MVDTGQEVRNRPCSANVKGHTARLVWKASWARKARNLWACDAGPMEGRGRRIAPNSRLLEAAEGRGLLLKKKKKA